MIVTSEGFFPKQYKMGYKYCLMVGSDKKVKDVWNYTAMEWMNMRDENFNLMDGKLGVNQVKKMLKNGTLKLTFIVDEIGE